MTALDGMVALEVCRGVAGSLCTLQLADAGAEVIKVELPPEGDPVRKWGPTVGGVGSLFSMLNRDKLSVAVDYGHRDGLKVWKRLVARADVVVEDFQPGVSEVPGLRYEAARRTNPRLVHCSITPYGESGPCAETPASELEIQGASGMMWFMGQPGKPPVRVGADIASVGGAMFAFIGIVASLYWRMISGAGQKVSVSLLGSLLSMGAHWQADFSNPDDFAGGVMQPYYGPETGYQTKDRPLLFGFYGRRNDRTDPWHAFCRATGLEELLQDPWISQHGASMVGVGKDALEMKPLLENVLTRWSSDDLMRIIGEIGAGGAPFMSYGDLFSGPMHPQVQATESIVDVPHPRGGTLKAVLSPWATQEGFGRAGHSPPPTPGAHTDQVLQRVGYSKASLRRLREAGVIQ